MKKLVFILFLFCSALHAQNVWYVAPYPAGNDGNPGTESQPWATLKHATDQVPAVVGEWGDVIYLKTGVYNETQQSTLAPGISLWGEGQTESVIHSTVTDDNSTILLYSVEGTSGLQSISYIGMDGDMVAHSAISVMGRSDITIHHCNFEDFFTKGVTFVGSVTDAEPVIYATGNSFHDNTITNCADYYWSGSGDPRNGDGKGNLHLGGQDGMEIYLNDIEQPDRGANNTGYCIKYQHGGFCKGLKIFNNTIHRSAFDGSSWDFAIELWHSRGGVEIYNNDIQGGIDIAGGSWGGSVCANDAGSYGYAVKIYNNTIGFSSIQPYAQVGVYLERIITGGVYIYNNLFRNHHHFLEFYQGSGDVWEDVYFYTNIISGVGGTYANGVENGTIDGSSNVTYDNVNFVNNTIYAGTTNIGASGLRFTFRGTATNVTIRNNIIMGFVYYPIYFEGGTVNTLSVENNLYYGNGGTNAAVYSGTTVNNKTEQNNVIGDPLFKTLGSDFHLSTGSPAIWAGITVAWCTKDYEGKDFLSPRSIGAYEYNSGSSVTIPVLTTTALLDISTTTAVSGGNITSDGGASVTARGVCWSTNVSPTISDSHTSDGTGTGTFVSTLTGLTADTIYYIRAYATNSAGTGYGEQRSFKTDPLGSELPGGFGKLGGTFIRVLNQFVKIQ